MLKTGLPVTIELFQWVTSYGVTIQNCFDKTHDDYRIINEAIKDPNCIHEMTEESLDVIHNFLRWFVALSLTFDGGIFTANIQTVGCYDTHLNVRWNNGISQSISLTGWDRDTRKAFDYIVYRLCAVSDALENLDDVFYQLPALLTYYLDELSDLLSLLNNAKGYSFQTFISKFDTDYSIVFLLLSALPAHELSLFYNGFSDLFTEDLAIDIDGVQLRLSPYFSMKSNNEVLLIDRVKMHYNILLCSSVDQTIKNSIIQYTKDFILGIEIKPEVTKFVSNQLNQIHDDQLEPRYRLLDMVLNHFEWGK